MIASVRYGRYRRTRCQLSEGALEKLIRKFSVAHHADSDQGIILQRQFNRAQDVRIVNHSKIAIVDPDCVSAKMEWLVTITSDGTNFRLDGVKPWKIQRSFFVKAAHYVHGLDCAACRTLHEIINRTDAYDAPCFLVQLNPTSA